MANMIDYMHWRGDLKISQDGLCDVDALILSRLSYLPFEDTVPESFRTGGVSVSRACAACLRGADAGARFIQKEDRQLMELLEQCARFRDLKLFGCVNRFDEEKQEQFFAVCVDLCDGRVFVSFRGTDNTVVGWKEDFNMSFKYPVPSQLAAVQYIQSLAMSRDDRLILGGHSKGGNLAMYAAVYAPKNVQDRISAVYNNDGPGFVERIVSANNARDILPRIKTFAPQSSVIGMLFEHEEQYTVVCSTQTALMQHDIYSWQVMGNKLICLESFTDTSQRVNETMNEWIRAMDSAEREAFVEALFYIIEKTEIKDFKELSENWLTGAGAILKSLTRLDEKTRNVLKTSLRELIGCARRNISLTISQREGKQQK